MSVAWINTGEDRTCLFRFIYVYLDGNRLSRIRVVAQLVAPPIAPPTTAFPTKAAPVIIIGAIFVSGLLEKEENESCAKVCILKF